jgi:hypothetical protein
VRSSGSFLCNSRPRPSAANLAGRLRTKWVALHTHEVFFRDTAHGFIAWCVALVVTTILFASYAASLATRTATLTADNQSADYFADRLFRSDHPASARVDQRCATKRRSY